MRWLVELFTLLKEKKPKWVAPRFMGRIYGTSRQSLKEFF